MIVIVKEEHIKSGYRGMGSLCPIARAIADSIVEARQVFVTHTTVTLIFAKDEYIVIELTEDVVKAIITFDCFDVFDGDNQVKPFEFELDIDAERRKVVYDSSTGKRIWK